MGGYGPPTPWYDRQEPYEMHAFGGYGPQRPHIDNSAYYNYTPRWQDYPNYSWNDQEEGQYHPQQQYHRPQYQLTPQAPQPNTSPSFEDMMENLTHNSPLLLSNHRASSSKEVWRKIDQMTEAVAKSAQTVTNSPWHNPK